MNTTALNAYSQHSLSIDIKTSSGDIIELDFNNTKSLDFSSDERGKNFAFSSMESFSFSYEGNGIDAQDQKEIEAFLTLAQPNIDNFVEGLNDGSSLLKPISQITQNIQQLFQPIKQTNNIDLINNAKEKLVETMDKAIQNTLPIEKQTEKILSHAERFLEQMLKTLDRNEKLFYA